MAKTAPPNQKRLTIVLINLNVMAYSVSVFLVLRKTMNVLVESISVSAIKVLFVIAVV